MSGFFSAGTIPGSGVLPPIDFQGAGAAQLIGVGTTGDAFNRAELRANGNIALGTGAVAPDAILSRAGVGVLQTSGKLTVNGALAVVGNSLDVFSVGQGLQVAEGANAKQGVAVLVAGTVTVANTSVTANSRIFLTSQVDGGALGFLRVSARIAGTSFTITSSSGTDTSTVAYEIFEPG